MVRWIGSPPGLSPRPPSDENYTQRAEPGRALTFEFDVETRGTRELMQTFLAFLGVAVAGDAMNGDALAVTITFVGAKRPTRPDP